MKKDSISYIVCGGLIMIILYLLFYPAHINNADQTTVRYDTVYKYVEKHIIDTVPKLVYVKNLRIDTVQLYTKDSILVDVQIPIQQKQYTNNIDTIGQYNVWVSGYQTKLDSVSFRLKYPITTIYVNTTKTVQKRFDHGIQIGIGYGIINKNPDIYIGYGFRWKF